MKSPLYRERNLLLNSLVWGAPRIRTRQSEGASCPCSRSRQSSALPARPARGLRLAPAPRQFPWLCRWTAQLECSAQLVTNAQFGVVFICGFVCVCACFLLFFEARAVTLLKLDPQLVCLQSSPLLLPLPSAEIAECAERGRAGGTGRDEWVREEEEGRICLLQVHHQQELQRGTALSADNLIMEAVLQAHDSST